MKYDLLRRFVKRDIARGQGREQPALDLVQFDELLDDLFALYEGFKWTIENKDMGLKLAKGFEALLARLK